MKRIGGWLDHRAVDIVITILFLAVMVRLLPVFPDLTTEGFLDAINRAVANHLLFGRDVVLTHGPYASVYTSAYYPGIEPLRLLGQILIAASFSASFLSLFQGWKRVMLIPALYLLTVAERPLFCDAIFYALPWLLVLVAFRYASDAGIETNWQVVVRFALIVITLSLIALVKASFTLATFLLTGLALVLVWRRCKQLAASLAVLFLLGIPSFWALVGQPVSALLSYFLSQVPMVSGYTDGISTPGRVGELAAYMVLSFLAAISLIVFLSRAQPGTAGSFLVLLALLATLLVCAKAGFVRHTVHGMIAADAIALTCVTLVVILPAWNGLALFTMAFAFWAWSNNYYSHLPVPYIPHPRLNALSRAYWSDLAQPFVEGIRCQLDPSRLQAHYENALGAMAVAIPLPHLSGPTDIQDSRYDLLAANGIAVRQRPIVESYSTYTPKLAQQNARYFERDDRPENLFFRVTAVDNRLPSLEDSLCWPLWLTAYQLDPTEGPPYILLTKREGTFRKPEFTLIREERGRLGQELPLPPLEEYLWAEIELPSTLLGSFASTLFKRPRLSITYRYPDGRTESFRYIEKMGRAGFILSPVIHDTAEFVALHEQRSNDLSAQIPVSFSLATTSHGGPFWQQSFRVRFLSPKH